MSDALAAPASRNSPCPCGSGRRFKDCHGALGRTLAGNGAPPSRQSSYRASGAEWAHLDEVARDALGARMEHALALQMAGRMDEAAGEYRDVIAAAPDTHDALHMLGVIELGRGNLDAAERLISTALALRPPYAAIEHNLQLVEDARIALARAQPEQLAERALPILAELVLAPGIAGHQRRAAGLRTGGSGPGVVHLIGRYDSDEHDDGWLLRRLADVLENGSTVLWATDGGGVDVAGARRVQCVDGATGAVPRGGTHVFVGVDFECADWIERADAERVIVFCQSAAPTRYVDQLRAIARDGARPIELVFLSQAMAERFGPGHAVLTPPLDVATPATARAADPFAYGTSRTERPATWPVGILGQSRHGIGEPPDADFARMLGGVAGALHIYDPGRFRYLLGGSPIARFFPRLPGGLEPFLAQLGCFVHRTETWWQDTAGRELYAAMALGVPVLCPRRSIHAERIVHGVDGLLFETDVEARQQVSELRQDREQAAAIGRAGRTKALALADREMQARRYREFILGARDAVSEGAQWKAAVAR